MLNGNANLKNLMNQIATAIDDITGYMNRSQLLPIEKLKLEEVVSDLSDIGIIVK